MSHIMFYMGKLSIDSRLPKLYIGGIIMSAKHFPVNRTTLITAAVFMLSTIFTACNSKPTAVSSSTPANNESSSQQTVSESQQSQSSVFSMVSLPLTQQNSGDKNVSKSSAPVYNSKSFFNSAAKRKETKISIVNSKISAPKIASSAAAASIIPRTKVEGVDGSFIDPKITETVKDLGGKTYIFAAKDTDFFSNGKTATKDALRCYKAIKSIEKDYNCKIKIKTLGSLRDITATRSAGKVYANIFEMQATGAGEAEGLLISRNTGADLAHVSTVGVKTNQWSPATTLITSYKSKVLGVSLRYDWSEQNFLFFNKKLEQKYNLGDFYSMVDKGQWTDDLFLQVCEQYKKVGPKGTYAIEALYPTFFTMLVYSNWSSPFGITNTKYIFNGTDDSVLNILNYTRQLVSEKLYDPYYTKSDMQKDGTFICSASDWTRSEAQFAAGKSLFYIGSNGSAVLPHFSSAMSDNYGIIPLPKGPSADTYTTVITNALYFGLLDGDPDIENSGALLTAIANRTNVKTTDIVANNAVYVRDQQSLTNLTNNYKYKQILNVELSAAGKMPDIFYGGAVTCVLNGSQTPKQAMEAIARKSQTEVNIAYGQS